MNSLPKVSVVMGVYNGEKSLVSTIDSIVLQNMTDWEFVIVDDASTDSTAKILYDYAARDSRFRVYRQSRNCGLTHALIRGCSEARGTFIARQDTGDYTLQNRLLKQCNFLEEHPEVVAVGAGIRRIGPCGEYLGDTTRKLSPAEVTKEFLETGKAIVHAAAMIRRSSLDTVGSYRPQFRVAQDIDLWYRLCALGPLSELPDVLSCISIDLKGISALSNGTQHRLAAIARACYESKKLGLAETELLEQADIISSEKNTELVNTSANPKILGEANYFVGSELLLRRNPRCRAYFARSIRCRNQMLRSASKYLVSLITCSSEKSHQPICDRALDHNEGVSP